LKSENKAKDATAEPEPSGIAPAEFQPVVKRAGPHDIHIRTFRSAIDGSVQSYAVLPAAESTTESDSDDNSKDGQPGMIVTLHDAGTTCEEHLAQYKAKTWAHIVAPQGRRPNGFDWEAWGRHDVFEALADARQHYPSDGSRTYLTGYSMGGHGAWHIGATRPDQFAAIAPIGGWISFSSYGGGMPSMETPTAIEALLLRGYSASDTLKLLSNLGGVGVYVLHGAADQTVPVAQARFMRSRLAAFHSNFVYYEEPGAEHWWGNESCDAPRMMEFIKHAKSLPPAEQLIVDFTTANPAVSNKCHWVSIEGQQEQLNPSHVAMRQNPRTRTFVGNTSNVARLAIDVAHLPPNEPIDVTLDGQELNWLRPDEHQKLWFERQGTEWSASTEPEAHFKGSKRNGTFNAAFDHEPLLVHGTGGGAAENAWAAAKARFDAETFYYRGGGALEVIPDTRFNLESGHDRTVILYGNADTNRAWPLLFSTSPVEVRSGHVRVGNRTESGDDLAVVMVRPRPGSDVAMVGVVAGTGPVGMQLTNRLRWYVSGIVYPDLMILEPKFLSAGTGGVRAWGYFGNDWGTETGEIAWRDAPPTP
jgi:predicted esterase